MISPRIHLIGMSVIWLSLVPVAAAWPADSAPGQQPQPATPKPGSAESKAQTEQTPDVNATPSPPGPNTPTESEPPRLDIPFGSLSIFHSLGFKQANIYLDYVVTALILTAGADRIAELLKLPGSAGAKKEEPQPIEVTGKLVLEGDTERVNPAEQ